MNRKFVSVMILIIILIGMSSVAFKVQKVKASGPIYIRADGSVDPSTAPIQRNGDVYTLAGNITSDADGIVIERNNMTLDGAVYTIQGTGTDNTKGIRLTMKTNVTISNLGVKGFWSGIWLEASSFNSISRNDVTNTAYGICILGSSNNIIIGNNIANNQMGVFLNYAMNNVLKNNSMVNNAYNFGVWGYSLSAYVNDVDASNIVDGKPIYYWINQHNKSIPANAGYVALINSTRITMENLTLESNFNGISLVSTTNSTIKNTKASNCIYGIFMFESSNNKISDGEFSDNEHGIYLDGSDNMVDNNIISNNQESVVVDGSNNTIYRNILINNDLGIFLPGSYPKQKIYGNNVSNNIVTNSEYGILLNYLITFPEMLGPSNNIISNNIVTNNEYGILTAWSSTRNNLVSNNIIANNSKGFFLDGYNFTLRNNIIANNGYNFKITYKFLHDIDTSNTINGKPIYYLVKQSNILIDPSTFPNIGYLGIIDSTNIMVKDLTLANIGQGLLLVQLTNSTIKKVEVSNCDYGIYVYWSRNNSISENSLVNNRESDISLDYSDGNSIYGNLLSSNTEGFSLSSSNDNFMHDNTISNNAKGISIVNSKKNTIYHNNFINNTWQIVPGWSGYRSINKWNNSLEGNYWSDYNGSDLYSGPYQNKTGSDGVGDSLYEIDIRNADYYPLMGIFHSFNTSLGYRVNVISNSTLDDFEYLESNNTIIMHVSSMTENQTYGFCKLTIPHNLLLPSYNVTINNNPVAYTTVYENDTLSTIYFSYEHSTLEIVIVPEFPPVILLPLFMIATFLAVTVCRRKHFM